MASKIIESGKRKTAVARAVLKPEGKGVVTINGRDHKTLQLFNKLEIETPLRIAQKVLGEGKINFDVEINVKGGGEKSQINAAKLALAKVIVTYSKSTKLKEAYENYDKHLLVADTRRKEAYKPGDSKARSKRQTSYR